MARFTQKQVDQLLKPINPTRVMHRKQAGMNLSYISQQDARAHMIRVFGYGGFDSRTLNVEMLYASTTKTKSGSDAWEVGVLATVEVTIRNPDGDLVCIYSESAIASSTQPSRGEASDMAVKSATSDAFKRCLINLGDQFALSLYGDGSTVALVRGTLVTGEEEGPTPEDEARAALESIGASVVTEP